jgi:hypothetical protein
MLRRRQINAEPGGRGSRPRLTALGNRARDAGGWFEEHLLWRLGDLLRGVAEVIRWPLERLVWTVERRLVWPLQERVAGRGAPLQPAGAGALAALAFGAAAIGAVAISGGGNERDTLPSAAPLAASAPAPAAEEEPEGPALQGVPPKFGVGAGVGVEAAGDTAAAIATDGSTPDAPVTSEAGSDEETGATSSSQKPVPAGPAAMKVARRFSEAFVFYEVGEQPERALTVFAETATPRLATALAERPPRQPESTPVPKARVLNLVPGPRQGRVYTVSASLLRVGVTSELRLKMTMRKGAWLVTDVRG